MLQYLHSNKYLVDGTLAGAGGPTVVTEGCRRVAQGGLAELRRELGAVGPQVRHRAAVGAQQARARARSSAGGYLIFLLQLMYTYIPPLLSDCATVVLTAATWWTLLVRLP